MVQLELQAQEELLILLLEKFTTKIKKRNPKLHMEMLSVLFLFKKTRAYRPNTSRTSPHRYRLGRTCRGKAIIDLNNLSANEKSLFSVYQLA